MSVYIIAEAGVNHNGDIELAKKMVALAKKCGVDCIKFQTFISRNIVSKNAKKADYQAKNTDTSENQLAMLKKLELSDKDFLELKKHCESMDIDFLSTPFDLESIDFLESIDISKWKIPSGEITNLPYLKKISESDKSIIMSTGMSNINEIEAAIDILNGNGKKDITLLHCNTQYPTPMEDVNLRAMLTLREKFLCPVGYSDHTKGIEVAIAAAALGANVIEKHFTLDNNMDGPDHKASLEPEKLKEMVIAIRNIENAMGNEVKAPTKSEKENINIARKSIVAQKAIKKGEVLSEKNITVKRPGNGISPMKYYDIIGNEAIRDFSEDELIEI